MFSPPLARWIARLIFGAFAGALALIPAANQLFSAATPYALEITLTSSTAGTLQIFYDRGRGISESESVATPLAAASAPRTYRVMLPAGSYRLLRIDPGERAGVFLVSRIQLIGPDGKDAIEVPLEQIRPAVQSSVEVTPSGLIVRTPSDANDPQLVYSPSRPMDLTFRPWSMLRAALVFALVATIACVLLIGVERGVSSSSRRRAIGPRLMTPSAPALVVSAGVLASVVGVYPLFLGQSLVSPNNGGAALYYDLPPFAYSSGDFEVEDARQTDVGSMMWAILPYSMPQREAIATGEWPLWNRYNAIGRPLLGQGQTFFLEPLHLLTLVVPEPALRADLTFIGGRMIFAAGVGLAALAATQSLPGALVAAIAAPFIGYFSFRFNHPAYFSIVYAPFILWAYFRLAAASSMRDVATSAAALVAASALQLVGSTPKEGVITFAIAHFAGLLAIALAVGSRAERTRRVVASVVAGAVALLVTAPHWLMFLDTLARSTTLSDSPDAQLGGWFEIGALVLGPWKLGMPYPSVNGMIAVLVVAALVDPAGLWRQRAVIASLIAAVFSIAIAVGVLPGEVIAALPFLRNLHHVWNVFLTASLTPLLVVAAAGFESARDLNPVRLFGIAIGTIGLMAVIDIGLPDPLPTATVIAVAAALVPGAALVLLAPALRQAGAIASASAVTIVVACGLLAGGLHVSTRNALLDSVLLQPRDRIDLDEPPPAVRAIKAEAGTEPFRVASLHNVMFAGTQAYYGLEGITGPDALELPELRKLFDAVGVERIWGWRTILRPEDLVSARGLLDMLGVRFVFARAEHLPSDVAQINLPGPDLVHVMKRADAWPRAFFVDGVERHADVGAFAERLRSAHGAFASIEIDDTEASALVASLVKTATRVVPARDYSLTPNSTTFSIDAPGPGLAVLAEAFVPEDFQARINGNSVGYVRVNHALKGVVIREAGTWRVEFVYRPARWALAWALAAMGSVVGGVAFHLARRRPHLMR